MATKRQRVRGKISLSNEEKKNYGSETRDKRGLNLTDDKYLLEL